MKKLTSRERRLFITDHNREYENGVIFERYLDVEAYLLQIRPSQFRAICRFQTTVEYDALVQLVKKVRDYTLLAEECQFVAPVTLSKLDPFLDLIRYGRHSSISIVGVSQSASEVAKDLRRQARHIITFRQVDPDDLAALKKRGFDPAVIAALKDREFVEKKYGG